jgi:hypothetical protein
VKEKTYIGAIDVVIRKNISLAIVLLLVRV